MNDETLQELLKQADERFQAAAPSRTAANVGGTAFVEGIRQRRTRQARRRTSLGVLAVLLLTAGVSAWSLNADIWRGTDRSPELIASNEARESDDGGEAVNSEAAQGRRLRDDEIARLRAEIAALDAEANQAHRFVELYQAAEARRERLAAVEAAHAEPLLSPQALADLEIDRAAAITVISADAQARDFNRPDDAAQSYRAVLRNFPSSRWASVARERLAQTMN